MLELTNSTCVSSQHGISQVTSNDNDNKADERRRREQMLEAFRSRFNTEPTVGARAPGRVDLMGSHTDYNEGFVLTLAINRDTWIMAAPGSDNAVNLASLNLDSACQFDVESFDAKIEGWGQYVQGVAAVLHAAGHPLIGFDGLVHGTVPIGSGLSSSASLEAAAATLFEQLGGFELGGLEKAKLCQQAENEWVGVNCGILDQYSSILGEAGEALILDCRSLTHQYATMPANLRPVICNTCAPRKLTGSEYGQRRTQCEQAASYFGEQDNSIKSLRDVSLDLFREHQTNLSDEVRKRAQFIIEENARVGQLAEALKSNDLPAIKELTAASFVGARDLFEISVPAMQQMFDTMISAPGCVGCRQAGAGFGGCMIALVATDHVTDFCESVTANYERESGLKPEVYPVQTAPSAGKLALD